MARSAVHVFLFAAAIFAAWKPAPAQSAESGKSKVERMLFVQIEGLEAGEGRRSKALKALMQEASRLVDTQLSIIGEGGLKALQTGLKRPNSYLLSIRYTMRGREFDIEAALYDEEKQKILSRAKKSGIPVEGLISATSTAARICFSSLGAGKEEKDP